MSGANLMPMHYLLGSAAAGACSCVGWSEADLDLSGWWYGNGTEYNGSPWAGAASLGASGGRDLANGSKTAWTIGTAVNGFSPGTSDGQQANDISPTPPMQMTASGNFPDYVAIKAMSGWALVKPTTGPKGTGGMLYHTENTTTGGYPFFLYCSVGGALFKLTPNGGSASSVSRNAITMDAWNLITFRYGGTQMEVGINEYPGRDPHGVLAYTSNLDLVSVPLNVGLETFIFAFQATAFAGDILSLGIINRAMTNDEFCKIRCKLRDRYALALAEPALEP